MGEQQRANAQGARFADKEGHSVMARKGLLAPTARRALRCAPANTQRHPGARAEGAAEGFGLVAILIVKTVIKVQCRHLQPLRHAAPEERHRVCPAAQTQRHMLACQCPKPIHKPIVA